MTVLKIVFGDVNVLWGRKWVLLLSWRIAWNEISDHKTVGLPPQITILSTIIP